jgi:hypothetical protein
MSALSFELRRFTPNTVFVYISLWITPTSSIFIALPSAFEAASHDSPPKIPLFGFPHFSV